VFLSQSRQAYLAADRRKTRSRFLRGLKLITPTEKFIRTAGPGIRKKARVPFLDRSNPINKYIA